MESKLWKQDGFLRIKALQFDWMAFDTDRNRFDSSKTSTNHSNKLRDRNTNWLNSFRRVIQNRLWPVRILPDNERSFIHHPALNPINQIRIFPCQRPLISFRFLSFAKEFAEWKNWRRRWSDKWTLTLSPFGSTKLREKNDDVDSGMILGRRSQVIPPMKNAWIEESRRRCAAPSVLTKMSSSNRPCRISYRNWPTRKEKRRGGMTSSIQLTSNWAAGDLI